MMCICLEMEMDQKTNKINFIFFQVCMNIIQFFEKIKTIQFMIEQWISLEWEGQRIYLPEYVKLFRSIERVFCDFLEKNWVEHSGRSWVRSGKCSVPTRQFASKSDCGPARKRTQHLIALPSVQTGALMVGRRQCFSWLQETTDAIFGARQGKHSVIHAVPRE